MATQNNALTSAIVNTHVQTMSTREIAETTGKHHAHVMRDVRTMVDVLKQNPDLDFVCKTSTYVGSNGQSYEQYELDKDTCLTLLLGYDPVARMKVVKRWQELEDKARTQEQPKPLAPPIYILSTRLEAAHLLGVPLHIAQVEAVKEARLLTGEDFTPILKLAPAQSDIEVTQMMLEPTELGKRRGISGGKMNKLLAEAGLQINVNESWQPTALGKPLCSTHQWVANGKSGYNLKWNVSAVERCLEEPA